MGAFDPRPTISPPITTTAPTGPSPAVSPSRASRKACVMKRSSGVTTPRYHRSVKPFVILMAAIAIPNLDQLKPMSARFAPVQLKHDESNLSAGDRKALPKLVEAA